MTEYKSKYNEKAVGLASKPRVTIGLTCFNAVQTIERAIKSALSQEWSDLEVIVVDDASTDGSWEVVCQMSSLDPRIKVVRHAVNKGAAEARNAILKLASGEFVAFFDDDDESFSQRIRVQYEALKFYETTQNNRLVACYSSGLRIYPNGYELHVEAIGSRLQAPQGEMIADYLLFNSRIKGVFYGAGTPTCGMMARTSTFLEVGGFDVELRRVEDIDFAIRLALAGGRCIGCPEILYTQYATFSTDKTPAKNFEAELHLINKHAGYLLRKGKYDYAKRWFKIRYYHFSGQHLKCVLALTLFLSRYPIAGVKHLLRSAPARFVHELKMSADSRGADC